MVLIHIVWLVVTYLMIDVFKRSPCCRGLFFFREKYTPFYEERRIKCHLVFYFFFFFCEEEGLSIIKSEVYYDQYKVGT